MTLKRKALSLSKAGVQPLEINIEKRRTTPWSHLQSRFRPPVEVESGWDANAVAIAVICGRVSGNLLCIDFDAKEAFPQWLEAVAIAGRTGEVATAYREESPNGVHLLFRCERVVEGNEKLALARQSDGTEKTLIETRGEGGYVLVAPSPGYQSLGGSLEDLPVFGPGVVEDFLTAARAISEGIPTSVAPLPSGPVGHGAVEDWSNKHTWQDLLVPDGWTECGFRGGITYWTRPGKQSGVSASTGFKNQDNLIVFTSNATGLRQNTNYTKFGWLAATRFGGDFKAATRHLRAEGHGYGGSQPPALPAGHQQQSGLARQNGQPAQPAPVVIPGETGFDDEEFPAADLSYNWEPYLPEGKVVILDAAPGAGKTSFMLAIAACFSRGVDPWQHPITCGAGRTRYFYADSDMQSEMETVYRRCGGVRGMIRYHKGAFELTKESALEMRKMADRTGDRLVVVDPVLYYMGKGKLDSNAFESVQPKMTYITEAFEGSKASVVLVRHTNKGSSGNEESSPSADGIGSQAFRAVARGQLVAKTHPDIPGLVVVRDLKGSLLARKGEPFAFRRVGGSIEWVPDFPWPEKWKDGAPSHTYTTNDVGNILSELLAKGPRTRMVIRHHLETEGVPFASPVAQTALLRHCDPIPPQSLDDDWQYQLKRRYGI